MHLFLAKASFAWQWVKFIFILTGHTTFSWSSLDQSILLKEVGFDAKAFEADISPVLDCTTTT